MESEYVDYEKVKKMIHFSVTIGGREMLLKKHQMVFHDNGKVYVFLGAFDSSINIPNVNCIFILPSGVQIRNVNRLAIPDLNRKVKDTMVEDNGELIKTKINDEDDELMIVIKSLFEKDSVTVEEFRQLYGDRKADMNNDKVRIETKNTLSWNKFKTFLKMCGYEYELNILEKRPQ